MALGPNVVLVERSVARKAQDELLERGISLALNMKRPVLDFIARCTGTEVGRSCALACSAIRHTLISQSSAPVVSGNSQKTPCAELQSSMWARPWLHSPWRSVLHMPFVHLRTPSDCGCWAAAGSALC